MTDSPQPDVPDYAEIIAEHTKAELGNYPGPAITTAEAFRAHMATIPRLKLTRTLPITWGETSTVLPVVRLVATQKTSHPVAHSVPDAPFSILASEQVEVVVRAAVGEFAEVLSRPTAGGFPYAKVRFGEHVADALVNHEGEDLRVGDITWLFRLLLLRIPVAAIDIDGEWEKDEEHSYAHDGVYVTAVKPKPRLDAEVYVGEPDTECWRHVGTSEGGVTWA